MMNQMLNIAARISVTEAEGPGRRYAVWVQGCPMRCPGCCNPQYLPFESGRMETMSPEALAAAILSHRDEIEGVTFIGGEPFSQAAGLAVVATEVRSAGLSVMIFSGFTLEELRDSDHPEFEPRASLLTETDLLVDGRYLREQHVTNRRWIGSANQRVHFLTNHYRHLKENWDSGANTIEIRIRNGEFLVNGFPHPEITMLSSRLLKPTRQGGTPHRRQA